MRYKAFLSQAAILLAVVAAACVSPQAELEKRSQMEALRDVGREYLRHGQYTFALRELVKAEKIYADDHLLQDYLGLTYKEKKLYDKAIVHFKRAVTLKPDYAPARNNLGTAYLEKGEVEAAIGCWEDLIEDESYILYATPHMPHANLGYAYYLKQDYEKAQKHYQVAMQFYQDGFSRDLTYIKVLIGLGRTYRDMGKLEKAVEMLEKATATAPDLTMVHFDLAEAYRLSQQPAKARAAYRKVIAMAPPDSQLAAKAREQLDRLPPQANENTSP